MLSFAGVIVLILSHFGINTDVQTIVAIIGAVISTIGIVTQVIAHFKMKNAAVAAGAKVVSISGKTL